MENKELYKLAPICLFTYNRLDETRQTVEALQANYLAAESELFIFSDGPKNEANQEKVNQVRAYLKTITGFKKVIIFESSENKGLANSIIEGVTKIINQYGKAIVLEDDLIATANFLNYMNSCLDFYEKDERIISVCGYGLKIKKPSHYEADVYLYGRSSSWGWATWQNRWDTIDWNVSDWKTFKNDPKAIEAFNKNGSDMFKMLQSVTEGNANSWAIRFCYSQFKQNKYSVMPFKSKIQNIGFGTNGTNTKFKFSRFVADMDSELKEHFIINKDLIINKKIEKECYKYHSLPIRIYSRIRYIIGI